MAIVANLAIVKGREHRVDDIAVGHRIGEKCRGRLLSHPSTGRRIADRDARPVHSMGVRRLDQLQHPRAAGVHPVRPMMIADRFAVPIDLAKIDMHEIDRRIGRRPFVGERRRPDLAGEGDERQERQQQDGKAAATGPHNRKSGRCIRHDQVRRPPPTTATSRPICRN